MQKIVVQAPDEMIENLVAGLSHRAGWKPSEDKPDLPVPIPATKPSHRAHPSYVREERPILGPQGQPQGTQIIETWTPTRRELAADIAYEILWREAERGVIESHQQAMQELKKGAGDGLAVSISMEKAAD